MPHTPVYTVFGGTGFIGRQLIWSLCRTGGIVRVVTRQPRKAEQCRPAGCVGQVVPFVGDVSDDAFLEKTLQGATHVVNLVGILFETSSQKFFDMHTELPRRIASCALRQGVEKLVHVSALGARKNSPSAYSRSKAAGEVAVLEAFPKATILRPSIVFGADDGFFNLFGKMATISPILPLIGGGKTKFQPVFVCDVVAAILKCLGVREADAYPLTSFAAEDLGSPTTPMPLPEGVEGQTYSLGGSVIYTFKDLMHIVIEQTGRKCFLLPLPWDIAKIQARVMEMLPNPLLTQDQVLLLQSDNIVPIKSSGKGHGLEDLGVLPTDLESILPSYMDKYRVGGRFNVKKRAA